MTIEIIGVGEIVQGVGVISIKSRAWRNINKGLGRGVSRGKRERTSRETVGRPMHYGSQRKCLTVSNGVKRAAELEMGTQALQRQRERNVSNLDKSHVSGAVG